MQIIKFFKLYNMSPKGINTISRQKEESVNAVFYTSEPWRNTLKLALDTAKSIGLSIETREKLRSDKKIEDIDLITRSKLVHLVRDLDLVQITKMCEFINSSEYSEQQLKKELLEAFPGIQTYIAEIVQYITTDGSKFLSNMSTVSSISWYMLEDQKRMSEAVFQKSLRFYEKVILKTLYYWSAVHSLLKSKVRAVVYS